MKLKVKQMKYISAILAYVRQIKYVRQLYVRQLY